MKIIRPVIRGKQCGVYKLEFNDGWFYFGSSNNLGRRFSQWKDCLLTKRGKIRNIKAIYDDLTDVEMKIIELCSIDEKLAIEQRYITENFNSDRCLNVLPNTTNFFNRKVAFGQTRAVRYKQESPKPKRVAQFDMCNNLIKIHPSVTQTAKYFNTNSRTITKLLQGKSNSINGFILKKVNEDGSFESATKLRKILKFTKSGELVGEFYLTRLAAKSVGGNRRNVEHLLKGDNRMKSYKGFIFKYADPK